MNDRITFHKVTADDTELITLIAEWYWEEWKIPVAKTIRRLEYQSQEGIIFHYVLKENNIPIATGGLYTEVGIMAIEPKFRLYSPWLALLYTIPDKRRVGYGAILCDQIDALSIQSGFATIHLYTYTAEKLYITLGWELIERLVYQEKNMAIMRKKL